MSKSQHLLGKHLRKAIYGLEDSKYTSTSWTCLRRRMFSQHRRVSHISRQAFLGRFVDMASFRHRIRPPCTLGACKAISYLSGWKSRDHSAQGIVALAQLWAAMSRWQGDPAEPISLDGLPWPCKWLFFYCCVCTQLSRGFTTRLFFDHFNVLPAGAHKYKLNVANSSPHIGTSLPGHSECVALW